MMKAERSKLPEVQLLQVAAIPHQNGDQQLCRQSLYRVFWLHHEGDTSMSHLYVAGPGRNINLPLTAVGYQISFPEEALILLDCQHYEPFDFKPASAATLYACIKNQKCCADIGNVIAKMQKIDNASEQKRLLPSLLKVLLVYISRHFENAPKQADNSCEGILYSAFMTLMEEKSFERKPVTAYARQLSVSITTLNHAIKSTSGFTASHHIQQRIITKAKQAAIASQASMKEVAYELGFQDIAHFSKYFRVNTGMTFTDYKRNFQMIYS